MQKLYRKNRSLFQHFLCFWLGLITGAAAGLVGVGGGEFRLPILIHILNQQSKTAAAINSLVGLLTVTLSLYRRWGYHKWTTENVSVACIMATASILGSIAGTRYTTKLSNLFVKQTINIYLIAVGAWMLFESITHTEHFLIILHGIWKLFWAALLGIVIAFISAIFGVGGGEVRIPTLIYLFAIPIKEAGTISLVASVPTLAAASVTYHSLGHLSTKSMKIGLVMGTGSLVGVLIGTLLVPSIDKYLLKGLLGTILLLTSTFSLGSSNISPNNSSQ